MKPKTTLIAVSSMTLLLIILTIVFCVRFVFSEQNKTNNTSTPLYKSPTSASESSETSTLAEEGYDVTPVVGSMGEQVVVTSYPSPRQGIDAPDYSKLNDVWNGDLGFTVKKATLYRDLDSVPKDEELQEVFLGKDVDRYCYIELEVEIENISAVSDSTGTEDFDMSMFSIMTFDDFLKQTSEVLYYRTSYFKEHTQDGHEYLCFHLPKGETITGTLGYFILQRDADKELAASIGCTSVCRNAIKLDELIEGEVYE